MGHLYMEKIGANLDIRKILRIPQIYSLLQSLVRNEGHIISYINEYIKAKNGDRILDIGCGPADILNYLPEIEYFGFDLSLEYIENAKKKYGEKGTFIHSEVNEQTLCKEDFFDIVVATNVLHHLNDKQAEDLFKLAKKSLKKGGRLITCDGCIIPKDNIISKLMLKFDRGEFVRTKNEYLMLANSSFDDIKSTIRNDLSNIPITGIILECKK